MRSILKLIIFVISYTSFILNSKSSSFFDSEWSKSLTETLYIAQKKSYFDIPVDKAVVKMLNSFVDFDRNSRFLGPKEFKNLLDNTSGQFYGIGVLLAPKELEQDYILIVDILKNSPAEKSKLKRYDKIIAIDNKLVNNLSIEDALELIKDKNQFSTVELTILRDKELLKFKVKRDKVEEPNGCCYYLPSHNIGYCSISLFTQETEKKLESNLKKILTKDPKALIIDLRNNSGGVLQAAVKSAGLFLKPGSLIVKTKDKKNKIKEIFKTNRTPLKINLPIFILINDYTASAAEIFAGALSYYSRLYNNRYSFPLVFLAGTKTFGKGSVQEVIPISNDCALKITTCLYYLPNDRSIQDNGLIPDFLVQEKKDLKVINKPKKLNNLDKYNNYQNKKVIRLKKDHQIQSTINLISLLDSNLNKITSYKAAKEFLCKNYATQETICLEEL